MRHTIAALGFEDVVHIERHVHDVLKDLYAAMRQGDREVIIQFHSEDGRNNHIEVRGKTSWATGILIPDGAPWKIFHRLLALRIATHLRFIPGITIHEDWDSWQGMPRIPVRIANPDTWR